MRPIDADALMDNIKRDSKKAIDEGDKVGSFWLGYAAGSVIAQPTIQSVATDTDVGHKSITGSSNQH
jgi:peptidase E